MPEIEEPIRKARVRAINFGAINAAPAALNPNPFQNYVAAMGQARAKNKEAEVPVLEEEMNLEGSTLRGEATPNFSIVYDTAEEVQMRLRGTFISYKGQPVYVEGVMPINAKKTDLSVVNATGIRQVLDLKDPDISCRSFTPGFIDLSKWDRDLKTCGYLMRPPVRVFQQGMNNQNTSVIDISDYSIHNIGDFNRFTFMGMFEARRKIVPFSKELFENLSTHSNNVNRHCAKMLSTNFAVSVYRSTGHIHYRTTRIAKIDKGVISEMKPRVAAILGSELKLLNLI